MIKFRQKNFGFFGFLAGKAGRLASNASKVAKETETALNAAKKAGETDKIAKLTKTFESQTQRAKSLQEMANKVGGRRAALIGGGVAATGIGMMGTTMANGITGDGGMNGIPTGAAVATLGTGLTIAGAIAGRGRGKIAKIAGNSIAY